MTVNFSTKTIGRLPNASEIMQALAKANEAMVADTIDFLTAKSKEPKTGKVYKASYTGLSHDYTASAPGEYPAEKTGMLMDTLYRGLTKIDSNSVKTSIFSDQSYAFTLEGLAGAEAGAFASTGKSKLSQQRRVQAAHSKVSDDDDSGVRPWMTRALEDPDLIDTFPDRINNSLKQVGFS